MFKKVANGDANKRFSVLVGGFQLPWLGPISTHRVLDSPGILAISALKNSIEQLAALFGQYNASISDNSFVFSEMSKVWVLSLPVPVG